MPTCMLLKLDVWGEKSLHGPHSAPGGHQAIDRGNRRPSIHGPTEPAQR